MADMNYLLNSPHLLFDEKKKRYYTARMVVNDLKKKDTTNLLSENCTIS